MLVGVALGVAVVACRQSTKSPAAVEVRNPDYLVIRSLTREPDTDHTIRVDLPYAGSGYAFASTAPLLDLKSFLLAEIVLSKQQEKLSGGTSIWMPTTPEGRLRLSQWSSRNLGGRLGIFLKGKLIDAPEIRSQLSDGIPLLLASRQEAETVFKELHNGGAAD